MENADIREPMISTDALGAESIASRSQLGYQVHHVVVSPCAACKILRRKCADKCVLAPYFPPSDPLKFTTAHRIFGASNIIKLLQELPEDQRADAVSSMVYEANARLREPVYGCAGAISLLQKEVNELQAQLAKAYAEVATMQCHQADLTALLCTEMAQSQQKLTTLPYDYDGYINVDMLDGYAADANYSGSIWEPSLMDMI